MRAYFILALLLTLALCGLMQSLARAATAAELFGLYVYPAKGQSAGQQADDESICYKWARSQTHVDPAHLPPATAAPVQQKQGGAARGAARGAALGAVFGAITGNAGEGAAVGAVAGGVGGYSQQKALNNAEQHYAQASADEQRSAQVNDFKRAFSVCLEGKGYTVK